MSGGGDGGAGDARRQEGERQARVQAATDTINGIFNNKIQKTREVPNPVLANDNGGMLGDAYRGTLPATVTESYWEDGDPANSRQALYGQQKQAVYDLNKVAVDRQYAEAERKNRFGLARSGLLGGSADVDSNALLQTKTNEGLMQASAAGEQAAADLKTADERTRQSLISLAQSGVDTGTAQQMAMRNLDANAQTAAGNRGAATVGNLFGDLSQAYLIGKVAQGQQAGRLPFGQAYPSTRTSTGYGGTINSND